MERNKKSALSCRNHRFGGASARGMNLNETRDLNRDLLSVSGGVLRGAEKNPVRSSANPKELSCQKYNQNNLVSPLFYSLFFFFFT